VEVGEGVNVIEGGHRVEVGIIRELLGTGPSERREVVMKEEGKRTMQIGGSGKEDVKRQWD